jgi:ion channel-forming bestrophin family protein
MLLAFAVALKHHLREERGTHYDDLYPLVSHLPRHHHDYMNGGRPRSPGRACDCDRSLSPLSMLSGSTAFTEGRNNVNELPSSLFKHDRRDLACQGTLVQGNLPLEIANYLSNYAEVLLADGRLQVPLFNAMLSGTGQLVEVLTNCERILRTPIPLAYNIAISQTGIYISSCAFVSHVIVWVFMILLPFQLTQLFGWVTIPASMISAYILFSLLHISYEIENPFGYDINDLDLDRYCRNLAIDLDLICSYLPGQDPNEWLYSEHNKPLWPLQRPVSFSEADSWGVDTVKERLEERRRRVMELWGKGLKKVEEERAKHVRLKRKADYPLGTVIHEREVSPSSGESMV